MVLGFLCIWEICLSNKPLSLTRMFHSADFIRVSVTIPFTPAHTHVLVSSSFLPEFVSSILGPARLNKVVMVLAFLISCSLENQMSD